MNNLLLEEKHALLKNELCGNLRKKLALELRIGKQFEELKKLEITLEKKRTQNDNAQTVVPSTLGTNQESGA